jgi:hypothetical protein
VLQQHRNQREQPTAQYSTFYDPILFITLSYVLIPIDVYFMAKDLHQAIQHPSSATVLRGLYIATSCLCGLMVCWILIFPASWLVGRSSFHDKLLERTLGCNDRVTSMDISLKYKGHSCVQLTHNLPSVIWAAGIPFQLHPTVRKQYKRLHHIIGYLLISTSILMMVGVIIIFQLGLLYEHSFTDLPPLNFSSTPLVIAIGLWFLITAITAAVQARAKNFQSHQRFVIRHVASGIWVALQRAMLMTVSAFKFGSAFTRLQQRALFSDAAVLSIAICLVSGEIAIYLSDAEHKMKKVEVL